MHIPWLVATFCLGLPFTLANLINVTIDDQFGDEKTGAKIIYFPPDAWHQGEQCPSCNALPDIEQAYLGTWHNGTFNRNPGTNRYPNTILLASMTFYGSSVYVYCIVSGSQKGLEGSSDMTFFMDGEQVGTFSQPAVGTQSFKYNVNVYANDSLPLGNHTLTIQNGHTDGQKSLVLLDYVTYSYDDGLSSTTPATPLGSSNKSRGRILGGVFGTIGVLLLAALAFLVYRRFKHKSTGLPFTNVALSESPLGQHRRRWFQGRGRAPRPGHSFNPNLFVQRPIPNTSPTAAMSFPHFPSGLPSHTNATIPSATGLANTTVSPTASGQSERSLLHVIQEWRRRIYNETTRADTPPCVISQVDLSGHYDSADSYRPPLPPPPAPHRKQRFAVMNN